MKYEHLLEKLGTWIKVIQNAILGTIVLEGILVILIGVASNKVTDEFNLWLGVLIFCSILYLLLAGLRAVYQIKFPGSIVEELDSKRKLELNEHTLDRQKLINDYINQVIGKLNSQTCIIGLQGDENLCDQELQVRLNDLLNPVIKNSNIILDSPKAQSITLGLYLSFYRKFPRNYNDLKYIEIDDDRIDLHQDSHELITDKGILILEDDLNLIRYLPKDLLENNDVQGESLEIQSTIRRSFNNNQFFRHNFVSEGNNFTIICSEIPEVCSEDPTGVMFVIVKADCVCPDDLPYIFKIFNRLTSNYVYKYNDCIISDVYNTIQRLADEN